MFIKSNEKGQEGSCSFVEFTYGCDTLDAKFELLYGY